MLTLSLLLACSGPADKDDTAEKVESPTLTFVAPLDGETVPVGDVAVSVIVEDLTLVSPAKHNEGAPEGYIAVLLDGAEVFTTAETSFTVTIQPAGPHALAAELRYSDGDPLEPPVLTGIELTAE